jgi:hypothetical protein
MEWWKDWKWRILFLYKLAELIAVPDEFCIKSTDAFITKHKSKILISIIRILLNILWSNDSKCNYLITEIKID